MWLKWSYLLGEFSSPVSILYFVLTETADNLDLRSQQYPQINKRAKYSVIVSYSACGQITAQ